MERPEQYPPTQASGQEPKPEHRIADEWRDCVLVCSCGWRTADRTKAIARKWFRLHVHSESLI